MKISIKIICKTNRPNKDNTVPLFIRLTQNRISKLVSVGVSVNPSYWDDKAQELTSECPDRASLQLKIDSKLEALNKQIAKLEILDIEVTLDALTGSKSKQINPTIKEYFEAHIIHLKQTGKVNAAIKYKFTLSSLLKYCGSETKVASIDKTFLMGFEQFLEGVGNAGNSIANRTERVWPVGRPRL